MRRYTFQRPVEVNHVLSNWVSVLYVTYAWRRSRAEHDSYVTPSRDYLALLSKKATQLDWIEEYKDNIIYHAAWRANLYFLLLVAYHKQKRIIQITSTAMQYGRGVEPNGTTLSHSVF